MYTYGLRASEPGLLRRADLNLAANQIFIRRRKGSISATYDLDARSKRLLLAYLKTRTDTHPALFLSQKQQPIARQTVYDLFARYAEHAGIPREKRHPHILKHSLGTHLADQLSGTAVKYIQKRLGHKAITSTFVYTQLTPTMEQEGASALARITNVV
jgi:type 1 fimbriae regulatory protein FimB